MVWRYINREQHELVIKWLWYKLSLDDLAQAGFYILFVIRFVENTEQID